MGKIAIIAGAEYLEVEQNVCSGCAFYDNDECISPRYEPRENVEDPLEVTAGLGLVACIALNNGQAIFIKNTPEALAEYFAQKVTR